MLAVKERKATIFSYLVALEECIRNSLVAEARKASQKLFVDTFASMITGELANLEALEKKQRVLLRNAEKAAVREVFEEGEAVIRKGLEATEAVAFQDILRMVSSELAVRERNAVWDVCLELFHSRIWKMMCRESNEIMEDMEDEIRFDFIAKEEEAQRIAICITDLESAIREDIMLLEANALLRIRELYMERMSGAFQEELERQEKIARKSVQYDALKEYPPMLMELEAALRSTITSDLTAAVEATLHDADIARIERASSSIDGEYLTGRNGIWNLQIALRLELYVQYESAVREYGILLPYTKIGTAIVVDYEEKLRQGLLQYEEERRNYLKYRFEDQADSLTLDKINTLESVYRAKIWSAMRKAAAAIAEEQEQELRGALDSAAASWWAKMFQDHEDAVNALVFVDFFSMEVTKRRIIVNSQIVIRCDLMEEAEAEYLTALVVDEKSTRFDMAVQLEERIRDAIQREEDRWIVRFFTDHEDLAYIKRTNEIMYEERRARSAIRDEQCAGLAELIDQSVTETRKIEEEYEARVRGELTQSIHASKYRILFEQLAKDERRARKSLDKLRIREEVDVIHHFFERERGLLVEEQHNAFTDLLITEMEPSRRSALVEYEESLRQRMMQLFFNMTLRLRIRDLLKEEQEVRCEDILEPMYFAHCVKNFVVDESALIKNAIQDHEVKCRTALEEECRSKYFEWQREQLPSSGE